MVDHKISKIMTQVPKPPMQTESYGTYGLPLPWRAQGHVTIMANVWHEGLFDLLVLHIPCKQQISSAK